MVVLTRSPVKASSTAATSDAADAPAKPTARHRYGWQRFLGGYYIMHALLFASYWLARQHYLRSGSSDYSHFKQPAELERWEKQISAMLAAAATIRLFRNEQLDAFISMMFNIGKMALLMLAGGMDVRLGVYYLAAILLIFLLWRQPEYQGPSMVEELTPASLEQYLLDAQASGPSYLVECYTSLSSACVHFSPMLAGLSLQYASPTLKFGKLDVGRWPAMAKVLGVDIGTFSTQLPTLVLFVRGKEKARLPALQPDGSPPRAITLKRAAVMQLLELATTKEPAKPSGTSKASGSSRPPAGGRRR